MKVNFVPEVMLEEVKNKQELHLARVSLDRVAVIILGGGEGKRLEPLTKTRCKPAMTFGGRYSLIDIPISHSLSTGLTKIFVIGQYLVYTLQKHLHQSFLEYGISQQQIQLMMPEERDGKRIWYQGTADAIRQNLEYFAQISADYFLILSGDQLYNINFQDMINFGVETDADMVIAAQPVSQKDAKRMGLLRIEHGGSRLVDFYEKPQTQDILERFYTDGFTLNRLGYEPVLDKNYLGSMGIYLFKKQALFDLLKEDPREDFGKHLITTQMKKGSVHAYLYGGYWEDIGTIESYYHANLALTDHAGSWKTGLQCYDESTLILTKRYHLPGARLSNCKIDRALICEGAIIDAAQITHSVIGVRSLIGTHSVIRESIIMGNTTYRRPSLPSGEDAMRFGIGEHCFIQRAILDENVVVGNHVRLTNEKEYVNFDSSDGKIYVRDGIIVVPQGTYLPDGFTF